VVPFCLGQRIAEFKSILRENPGCSFSLRCAKPDAITNRQALDFDTWNAQIGSGGSNLRDLVNLEARRIEPGFIE
jgi:hypothetical protein